MVVQHLNVQIREVDITIFRSKPDFLIHGYKIRNAIYTVVDGNTFLWRSGEEYMIQ